MERRAIVLGVLVLIAASVITGAVLLSDYLRGNGGDDDANPSSQNEVLSIVYDDAFLGYYSTVWGSGTVPVGPPNEFEPPPVEVLSPSIYSYGAVNLSDDYINSTMSRFFPDLDIPQMDVSESDQQSRDIPYVLVENDTVVVHLLRHGGVYYCCKRDLHRTGDTILSRKNASEIAKGFLNERSILPEDIDHIEAGPGWRFYPNGTPYHGVYYVRFHRNVEGCPVDGYSMNNQINIVIDSGTQEVIEFDWHWPGLDWLMELENLCPVEQVLDFYGMDTSSDSCDKITKMNISYMVSASIQSNGYDASADTYYLAPYWTVYTELGRYYLLGIYSYEIESV